MKRWLLKPLGEIAKVVAGDPAPQLPGDFSDDGFPFVRMQDVGRFGQTTCLSETKDRLSPPASARLKHFPPGSILVPKSGASIRLNHRAILGIEAHVVSHLAVIIPNSSLNNRFAYYWLCATDLSGIAHKADLPSIKTSDLAKLQIPVPTLPEQEQIVKLMDEADELRKLRAQADRRTADLIPALFYDMFGDPATNLKGWTLKPFGELASNQDGRRKPVKASERAKRNGKFPYYGASGIIDYIDEYLFDETALLIAEDGANLLARSTPIAFMAQGKYWVNNHAHIVTENNKADLNFLCVALNLCNLGDYVTGSAQPKLNQANMNRIPIPVPPVPLQKEFAERMKEIREFEAEQAASRRRLEELFQSLLYRAFNAEF